jgi:hypothetical protein
MSGEHGSVIQPGDRAPFCYDAAEARPLGDDRSLRSA